MYYVYWLPGGLGGLALGLRVRGHAPPDGDHADGEAAGLVLARLSLTRKTLLPLRGGLEPPRFATLVLIGEILIISANLPRTGHGDDLYDEAIRGRVVCKVSCGLRLPALKRQQLQVNS